MGAEQHTEVERKYLVGDRAVVPLVGGPPGSRWDGAAQVELEAVYFDTPGLDLLRRGISLRRRTGGEDAGWHVKLPRSSGGKTEVRRPLGRSTRSVPDEVADQVRAVVRDRPLVPVATITTDRTEYRLVGEAGLLATVCDDRVSGTDLTDEGEDVVWREWELEVAEDAREPQAVLDAVEPALLRAGAEPAQEFSKVHRVLGTTPAPPTRPAGRRDDTGTVLRARLQEQVAVLQQQDAALRSGDPSAIHRQRIAARRLRAALTTCRPVLTRPVDDIREELRWLGQALGPARDAQVMRERIGASLADQPDELVMGPVGRRLDVAMRRREQEALAGADEAIRSERYYRLLDALDDLVDGLVVAEDSRGPAAEVLGRLVRRDAKRLRRAVRAVDHAAPPERDAALHEARKKAKGLRYAAELAAPVRPGRAGRLARRAKRVQEVLGQHQDTVMARRTLRELGAQSYLEGENGFTFGLLHGLEQCQARGLRSEFHQVWAKVPSPRAAERWITG